MRNGLWSYVRGRVSVREPVSLQTRVCILCGSVKTLKRYSNSMTVYLLWLEPTKTYIKYNLIRIQYYVKYTDTNAFFSETRLCDNFSYNNEHRYSLLRAAWVPSLDGNILEQTKFRKFHFFRNGNMHSLILEHSGKLRHNMFSLEKD